METHDCNSVDRLREAFDDNELDAVTSFAVQEHLDSCPRCRARHAWAREVRASLARVKASAPMATPALRARVRRGLEATRRRTVFAGVGIAAAFVVAALIGFRMLPRSSDDLAMDFARNHHASMQRTDPVKFASTDPRAVEMWLREQLPFALAVPRQPPSGYQLKGARLCAVAGKKVGYLLYTSPIESPLSVFIGRRGSYDFHELPAMASENDVAIRCGKCDGTTVAAWDIGESTYVIAGNMGETPLLAFARQRDSIP